MRWKGKPMGMWMLFHRSFESHLTTVLGLDAETAKAVLRRAKPRYRALIAGFPDFEKGDRFQMNLVNAAMVAAQGYYEYRAGHSAGMDLNACATMSIEGE